MATDVAACLDAFHHALAADFGGMRATAEQMRSVVDMPPLSADDGSRAQETKNEVTARVGKVQEACASLAGSLEDAPSVADVVAAVRALMAANAAQLAALAGGDETASGKFGDVGTDTAGDGVGYGMGMHELDDEPTGWSPVADKSAAAGLDEPVVSSLPTHTPLTTNTAMRAPVAAMGSPGSAFRTPGKKAPRAAALMAESGLATPTLEDFGLSAASMAALSLSQNAPPSQLEYQPRPAAQRTVEPVVQTKPVAATVATPVAPRVAAATQAEPRVPAPTQAKPAPTENEWDMLESPEPMAMPSSLAATGGYDEAKTPARPTAAAGAGAAEPAAEPAAALAPKTPLLQRCAALEAKTPMFDRLSMSETKRVYPEGLDVLTPLEDDSAIPAYLRVQVSLKCVNSTLEEINQLLADKFEAGDEPFFTQDELLELGLQRSQMKAIVLILVNVRAVASRKVGTATRYVVRV
ncbi:uncharacterized protein AMSG_10540 [Thecamonas trahens ATCC 50062]|uniref:Uncharacterized protein n=1 Tax=Thecamonas trahens ATCC 50062 TaxID=461836 RepID=A0A0L0DRJ9_THETB|nr:hypothetical protein AMSG_10540 [Thecamonas trahens ATCC 50062]KNC54887.1 hypothetical protein AMSG_10540 [Thecamonas trahens ATCC 50062]|eukprot:XP_013753479.1 hypothetical protein AMSG_10540 [Thecamonas trahens ATCC 50062]